jgi:hypothetical protein
MSDNNDFNFDVYGQENSNTNDLNNLDHQRNNSNENHNGDMNGNGAGQVESTGEPMSDDRVIFLILS